MSVTQEITEAVVVSDAELEAALVFTTDGYSDADGVDHVTAAVAAAEQSSAAAGRPGDDERSIYGLPGETRRTARERHEDELGRLVNAWPEARSTALRRAIDTAIERKVACQAAAEHDMEHGLEGVDETWPAARSALIEAAFALADAPIANATDALVRAECFIDAVDRNPTTGLPEDDSGYHPVLIECLKSAVSCLALQEPDTDEWDGAVRSYRKAVLDLDTCAREEASQSRAAMVEDIARESLADRTNDAQGRSDEAISTILGMEPPHVGGLLVQLELVGQRFGIDLRSYESRDTILGDAPLTARQFWDLHSTEALRRALALVSINAAKIRDRSYPSDWRAILDGFLSVHEGGRDTLRTAYDAELNADDLTAVQLQVPNHRHRPVLLFTKPSGQMLHVATDGIWAWEPIK